MMMHWLGSSHEGSDAQGCREGQADYKRQIDHDYQIRSVGTFWEKCWGKNLSQWEVKFHGFSDSPATAPSDQIDHVQGIPLPILT